MSSNMILLLFAFLAVSEGFLAMKSTHRKDIIGGEVAEPGQFPFMVGISIQTARGGDFFCGGTILSPKFVLTAAHCLDYREISNVLVIAGGFNVTYEEPSQQRRTIDPSTLKLHENWIAVMAQNDLGIIELPSDAQFEFNDHVKPVTLPRWRDVKNQYVARSVIASGWGRTQDDPPRSEVLRYVETEVMVNSECNHAFGGFVTPNNICIETYGGEKNVCGGDSGGPLMINEDGVLRQIGIASFVGPLGCSGGLPGAFVRITNFLEWIQANSDVVIED